MTTTAITTDTSINGIGVPFTDTDSPAAIHRKEEVDETNNNHEDGKSNSTTKVEDGQEEDVTMEKRPRRRRRMGCQSKLAVIEDDTPHKKKKKKLPSNQYECTLIRRAIYETKQKTTKSKKVPPLARTQTSPVSASSRRNIFGINLLENYKTPSSTNVTEEKQEDEQVYVSGDLSLGMKLNVQRGKVVITDVIPLVDGRASPAQLTGCINPGDTIIAIDGKNLIDLPLEDLINALKVLSPQNVNQPSFCIRFAIGDPANIVLKPKKVLPPKYITDPYTGLLIFENHPNHINDNNPTKQEESQEQTMVSQTPNPAMPTTLDDNNITISDTNLLSNEESIHANVDTSMLTTEQQQQQLFHERITSFLAIKTKKEKEHFVSKFFTMSTQFSILLRFSDRITSSTSSIVNTASMTQQDWIKFGKLALEGARLICDEIEFGKKNAEDPENSKKTKQKDPLAIIWSDGKSFSSRSRFSRVSGGGGIPVSARLTPVNDDESESDYDDDSQSNSLSSDGSDESDELLLRLAAHDDEWKHDIIYALQQLSVKNREKKLEEETNQKEQQQDDNNGKSKNDSRDENSLFHTLSNEDQFEHQLFTSILFGEENLQKISKIMSNRTFALPPDDFTVVLYDLALSLSSKHTLPKKITFDLKFPLDIGTTTNLIQQQQQQQQQQSSYYPEKKSNADKNKYNASERRFLNEFSFVDHRKANPDVITASNFLLKEAVPTWLATFQPLSWKDRRILWPKINTTNEEEQDILSSGVSVVSASPTWMTQTNTRKKELKETIEDIEMHPESRMETCSLVLFYFTRRILVQLVENRSLNKNCRDNSDKDNQHEKAVTNEEAISFVQKYGSYLNLNESLILCSKIAADDVIDELMKMADYDPCHLEIIKKLSSKKNVFLLYERNMLSALLANIPMIAKEKDKSKQKDRISLLVSAYPDLRPCQVRKSSRNLNSDTQQKSTVDGSGKKEDENAFYYEYLSMLLHPEDGNDSARQEPELVEDWCKLSVFHYLESSTFHGRSNFLVVASKTENNWMNYHRELSMLLDLSRVFDSSFELSLKLAEEIICNKKLRMDGAVVRHTLSHLRNIAKTIIEKGSVDHDQNLVDLKILRQILRLIHDMGTNSCKDKSKKKLVNVPDEIITLLKFCRESDESSTLSETERSFVALMVDTVAPLDALLALEQWTKYHTSLNMSLLMALQAALFNGAKGGLKNEVSGTLLRLQNARSSFLQSSHFSLNRTKSSAVPLHFTGRETDDIDHISDQTSIQSSSRRSNGSIWGKLVHGSAKIEK